MNTHFVDCLSLCFPSESADLLGGGRCLCVCVNCYYPFASMRVCFEVSLLTSGGVVCVCPPLGFSLCELLTREAASCKRKRE